MAMSNSPISGPNFNQNLGRLPSSASGTPGTPDAGAQFDTTDAVSIGQPAKLAGGGDSRGSAVEANLTAPQAAGSSTPSTINNAPTVLTVGGLSQTSTDHPELGLNGLNQPWIETMSGQVIAGHRLGGN
ncbi:MAG: hypothetical protein AMXMBFR33_26310 [Candidatus Xenobia bacterium]